MRHFWAIWVIVGSECTTDDLNTVPIPERNVKLIIMAECTGKWVVDWEGGAISSLAPNTWTFWINLKKKNCRYIAKLKTEKEKAPVARNKEGTRSHSCGPEVRSCSSRIRWVSAYLTGEYYVCACAVPGGKVERVFSNRLEPEISCMGGEKSLPQLPLIMWRNWVIIDWEGGGGGDGGKACAM